MLILELIFVWKIFCKKIAKYDTFSGVGSLNFIWYGMHLFPRTSTLSYLCKKNKIKKDKKKFLMGIRKIQSMASIPLFKITFDYCKDVLQYYIYLPAAEYCNIYVYF